LRKNLRPLLSVTFLPKSKEEEERGEKRRKKKKTNKQFSYSDPPYRIGDIQYPQWIYVTVKKLGVVCGTKKKKKTVLVLVVRGVVLSDHELKKNFYPTGPLF
jgi:hypothetical protein